jgi:hypothetical protein
MKSPLRILHLEDDVRNVELVRETPRIETEANFLASLEQSGFDLILADYYPFLRSTVSSALKAVQVAAYTSDLRFRHLGRRIGD